jgi:hypothetical protein
VEERAARQRVDRLDRDRLLARLQAMHRLQEEAVGTGREVLERRRRVGAGRELVGGERAAPELVGVDEAVGRRPALPPAMGTGTERARQVDVGAEEIAGRPNRRLGVDGRSAAARAGQVVRRLDRVSAREGFGRGASPCSRAGRSRQSKSVGAPGASRALAGTCAAHVDPRIGDDHALARGPTPSRSARRSAATRSAWVDDRLAGNARQLTSRGSGPPRSSAGRAARQTGDEATSDARPRAPPSAPRTPPRTAPATRSRTVSERRRGLNTSWFVERHRTDRRHRRELASVASTCVGSPAPATRARGDPRSRAPQLARRRRAVEARDQRQRIGRWRSCARTPSRRGAPRSSPSTSVGGARPRA